jgi:hypothetical protein
VYVIFDTTGQTARASLVPSNVPGELSFAVERDLYLEIMSNPFVLRELTLVQRDGTAIVERLTNIPRSNQTMEPVLPGNDGDVVLVIKWNGMEMKYAPHVRKVATHEFLFCLDSVLTPLCEPVKLSHETFWQMEYILTEEQLPFRLDLFKRASVFVSRPYVNFRYTYRTEF